jgi:hypothetical protein
MMQMQRQRLKQLKEMWAAEASVKINTDIIKLH